MYPFFSQCRHQVVIKQLILLCDEQMRHLCDLLTGGSGHGSAGHALLEGFHLQGHTHLKELVQIVGDDAHKAQSLQQGVVIALRQGQYTCIKTEDAEIAIQQNRQGVFHAAIVATVHRAIVTLL